MEVSTIVDLSSTDTGNRIACNGPLLHVVREHFLNAYSRPGHSLPISCPPRHCLALRLRQKMCSSSCCCRQAAVADRRRIDRLQI